MVLLTITPAAKSAIEQWCQLGLEPTEAIEDEPSLALPEINGPVTHTQLLDIVRALKAHHASRTDVESTSTQRVTLEAVLRGARVYAAPPTPKPAPTSQYVQLMARLRRDEELRAYERMINPPPPADTFTSRFPNASGFGSSEPTKEEDDVTYADVDRQITLIINILVTIIACSVAIWIVARHWSTPQRLALSMSGSGIIAMAEVAIYMGYIRRVKEAKVGEAKRVETKEVVDTWVIDGKKATGSTTSDADSTRHRKGKHR